MDTLFDAPAVTPAASVTQPPPPRLSSKGIAPGDIVEVDKKGRRFHAVVEGIAQRDSGRFDLAIRPLSRAVTFRQATVAEVTTVWRRAA